MQKADLIAMRGYLPEDENFIYKTWLDGLKYGNSPNKLDQDTDESNEHWFKYAFEEIEYKTFCEKYRKIINHILSKSGVSVKLACLKEDPGVIVGYSVADRDILHWVYVKVAWRNIGIASDLVPDNVTYVTHLTKPGIAIKRKKRWIFDPTLI